MAWSACFFIYTNRQIKATLFGDPGDIKKKLK